MLLAAAGGGVLALLWHRDRRTRLGAAAGVLAVAAFCVLAAAGLPIITRYMLLTGTLLAIFAGAGAFGWMDLRRGSQRTWWARFGAVALLVLALYVPDQARRIDRLGERAAAARRRSRATSREVVRDGVPCQPVAVPNRRPIPLLALWLEARPARDRRRPGSAARARDLPRAAHAARRPRLHPRPARSRPPCGAARPPASRTVQANASWIAAARC